MALSAYTTNEFRHLANNNQLPFAGIVEDSKPLHPFFFPVAPLSRQDGQENTLNPKIIRYPLSE